MIIERRRTHPPCPSSIKTEFEKGDTNMEDEKKTVVKKTVKSGITFGSALAMVKIGRASCRERV